MPLLASDDGNGLLFQATVVLGFGVGAQWLASLLRLPSILLLLVGGFVAGPVLGLVHTDTLLPGPLLPTVVSLSVALIMFEGGLTLRLQEAREVGPVVGRLVSIGVLVQWLLGSVAAWLLFDLTSEMAALIGSMLVLSGPTVVQPLLRHLRPRGAVGPILKWEGIVIDPVGALLATLVLQALLSGNYGSSLGTSLAAIGKAVLAGGACGAVGGALLMFLLARHAIPDVLQAPVTLGLVITAFGAANHLQHESGLLAVTLMGFLLSNQRRAPIGHIIRFKEHLTVLLIAALFILLAARVDPAQLTDVLFPGGLVFLLVLIVVVRPLAVLASTMGSELSWREKLFVGGLFPRGIVVAGIAPLFALKLEAAGLEGAAQVVPLTYLVIVGSVTFYGLASPWLARRLKVTSPDPQGALLVGADPVARALARALQAAGFDVILADTNRRNVAASRLEGLPARYCNVLAEEAFDELDLGGIGKLIAVTPNDEVNSLAALHGRETFGRAGAFQLPPATRGGPAGDATAADLRGRLAFGSEATYTTLSNRLIAGSTLRRTTLTEDFDREAFRRHHGPSALILFVISPSGSLSVDSADQPREPRPGDTVIALVDEAAAEEPAT